MAVPRTILRVRRTDVGPEHDQSHVLVAVQPIGPHPLDIKLIGTEGENVYPTSIRHNKAKDFQLRPAYKGSDAEWDEILARMLVKKPVDATDTSHGATASNDIEIVSAVSDARINLTLRKNIAGVTQRIGTIQLNEDNDEEISLFDWTMDAAGAHDRLLSEHQNLQAECKALREEVRKVKEQMATFVQAHQNHETAMLAKHVKVVNAKKLKIRDLQRLLACAKVDPVAAAAVEGARKSTRGTRAGPSRSNKRAASSNSNSDSEEDSSFESRKPKPKPANDEDEGDADVTPENSDQDETEDEQDGDMGGVVSVPGAAKPGEGAKKKTIETVAGNGNSPEQRKPDSPPPRRELPFTRKNGQSLSGQRQQSVKSPAADEDEDDTTDDEL